MTDRCVNLETFAEKCTGKSVCIVGNAASIIGTGQGEFIDSHNTVIRFSHAVHSPFPPEDAGSKTDIWVFAGACYRANFHKMPFSEQAKVCQLDRDFLRTFGKYLPTYHEGKDIHTIPCIGPVTLYWALRYNPLSVYVCGIDFFRTTDPAAGDRGTVCRIRTQNSGTTCHNHDMDERAMKVIQENCKPRPQYDRILQDIIDNL